MVFAVAEDGEAHDATWVIGVVAIAVVQLVMVIVVVSGAEHQ